MKIIKLSVLTLLFMLLSCSENEELQITSSTKLSSTSLAAYQHKEIEVGPDNLENPYDVAGLLSSELSVAYYNIPLRDTCQFAIIADVVSLAHSNLRFHLLSPDAYLFTDNETLQQILSTTDAASMLTESIQFSLLDVDLQFTFENFIHYMMNQCENDVNYASLYAEIVTYENSIQHNVLITEADKAVVLTTTSLLRHSLKAKRKRPKKNTDRDWDYMITTLGATAVGAKNDLQNAIILSLLTEISLTN